MRYTAPYAADFRFVAAFPLTSPLPQETIMLQKSASFPGIQGPVVTIVMDGYGIARSDLGSAIAAARKPTLDKLFANYPNITLRAHGIAVGMPSDEDMGNSEVCLLYTSRCV